MMSNKRTEFRSPNTEMAVTRAERPRPNRSAWGHTRFDAQIARLRQQALAARDESDRS
ncbi:Uncharacterised protein [Nocardia otitidiscaviarum]|uniref:Uncharacterized protein n=1 Tax=Nocardia otitidiscaviarum TaxID=1823 RepID=A0A378YLU2_9NOCA|nr:hypothetical protein [Nocardia otitidiscaviarum]SUA77743.1 Uncharacterised protein [Nocardia otitidiscaviarum]